MGRVLQQAGAAALYRGELLLLPSRRVRGRWVIPKGNIELGQTPEQAVAAEAFEEGGVTGEVGDELGYYFYNKRGYRFRVTVYELAVQKVHQDWPEKSQRRRLWLPPTEAAEKVEEERLQEILRELIRCH